MDSNSKKSRLSGPWWSNSAPINTDQENSPQEAFFRVEFPSTDAVTFSIATVCFYQVWLNGVWIGYGPARASHGRLTIDRWALSQEHLKVDNCVTVQALWEGIFTFDHVRGTPGVWMALDEARGPLPFAPLASSQTGRTYSHRFSHQRGWVEEIDGRKRAAGWMGGTWNPSEWQQASIRTNDEAVILEERDFLPFVTRTRRPESVTFSGAADLSAKTEHRALGYEGVPNFGAPMDSPSRNIQEEALRPSAARDENLAGLTLSGTGPTILHPDPQGLDRTVQLDFGTYASGMLELEISAPAGTQIDVGWSEIPWNNETASRWSESDQPGGSVAARECADSRQGLRYICTGAPNERLDGMFIMALRHMRLTFRVPSSVKAPITIHHLAVRVAGYPIEREGDFRCSDESLNRIHRAAVETMENSIHDVYMDCPGRERGGWLNDSYSAAVGMSAISSDTSFDRRFLRQFIDSLAVIPEMHSVAALYPSEFHRWPGGKQRPILCHSLFWVIQAERHLRLFGDEKLKKEWWPGLKTTIDGFGLYRSKEGFIENHPWDEFVDWSSPQGGPIQTFSNLIYGTALSRIGSLYNNAALKRDGAQTLEAIESAAWNEGRGLYADIVNREGAALSPGSRFSEVTNYIALWTGALPKEREEKAWRQMRNLHPRSTDNAPMVYELDLARGNAYSLLYRFEYQGRRGEIADLARDLKEAFLPMLERGQTTLSEHLACHFSLCHGFQGYVAHVLARYIGGIQLPDQPGGIIRFRPEPALMSWCQTRVPWMGGHVQLWCSRRGESEAEVIISLPAGQKGELLIGSQAPIEFVSTLQTRVRFGG
jgi:alpha-L-rhamnosidase